MRLCLPQPLLFQGHPCLHRKHHVITMVCSKARLSAAFSTQMGAYAPPTPPHPAFRNTSMLTVTSCHRHVCRQGGQGRSVRIILFAKGGLRHPTAQMNISLSAATRSVYVLCKAPKVLICNLHRRALDNQSWRVVIYSICVKSFKCFTF